jgi:hypothetical protein
LSQQAVAQDVAAKILCDNLQALTSKVAHEDADLPESVRINHAFAHTVLQSELNIHSNLVMNRHLSL